MESDLNVKVARGFFWSGGTQIFNFLVQFGVKIVLARLLIPEDFGLVGMSAIFMGLIAVVNDLGINSAIVQRKDITEDHLSTAFWANLVVGMSLLFVIIAISFPVAWFFDQSVVKYIMMISGIGLMIGPLTGIQRILFLKKMDFRVLGVLDIITTCVSASVSIGMALSGFGLWSLVFGGLSATIVSTIIIFWITSWRPRFRFHRQSFKDLFSFGSGILGFNVLHYGATNMDNFIIGKLLGPASLAYYSFAYNLATTPQLNLASVFNRVMFPAFSEIQNNNMEMKEKYLKGVQGVALISFPILTGLALIAPEFVPVVYGQKWTPMIIPFQILCITGIFYSVASTVGPIYLSKRRSDLMFKLGIVRFVALTLFILIGARYGVIGVAVGVSIYAVIFTYVFQLVANSLIDLKIKDWLRSMYEPVAGCLTMVVALLLFRYIRNNGLSLSDPLFLLIATLVGGAIYILIVTLLNPKTTGEMFRMMRFMVRSA